MNNTQSGNYCQPRCDEPWTEVVFASDTEGRLELIASPLKKLTPRKDVQVGVCVVAARGGRHACTRTRVHDDVRNAGGQAAHAVDVDVDKQCYLWHTLEEQQAHTSHRQLARCRAHACMPR